jgi:hypothetical protein
LAEGTVYITNMVIRKRSGAICTVRFNTFLRNTYLDYALIVAVLFFLNNSLTCRDIFLLIEIMILVCKQHDHHLNLYGIDLAINFKNYMIILYSICTNRNHCIEWYIKLTIAACRQKAFHLGW